MRTPNALVLLAREALDTAVGGAALEDYSIAELSEMKSICPGTLKLMALNDRGFQAQDGTWKFRSKVQYDTMCRRELAGIAPPTTPKGE